MNVLVVGFYSSRNRGDHMIAGAMLRLFRDRGCDVRLVADDSRDRHVYDVPVASPLVRAWPGAKGSRARLAASAARSYLRPAVPDDRYGWADVCVAAGGGYLYDDGTRGSRLNLLLRLAPLAAARNRGIPVVLFSQSIGPFRSRWWARLAARELRAARLVIARERYSAECARALGVRRVAIRDDAAFAYLPPTRPVVPAADAAVGVNVMPPLPGRTAAGYETYRAALRGGLAGVLRDRRRDAVVVAHVDAHARDSDVAASGELAAELGAAGIAARAENLVDDWDGRAPRTLAPLGVFVGSRMHSALAALCVGVPALALAYQPKTRGVFERLGLEELVLPLRGLSASELAVRLGGALDDRDRLAELVARGVARARESAAGAADLTLEAVA